jgi:hypothetical protein
MSAEHKEGKVHRTPSSSITHFFSQISISFLSKEDSTIWLLSFGHRIKYKMQNRFYLQQYQGSGLDRWAFEEQEG